jgi:hypothetical protein
MNDHFHLHSTEYFELLREVHFYDVAFEVFTAVVMNSIIIWDMTPCSPLSFNRCFGGTYRLNLRVEVISSAKTSMQAGCVISHKMILYIFINLIFYILMQK